MHSNNCQSNTSKPDTKKQTNRNNAGHNQNHTKLPCSVRVTVEVELMELEAAQDLYVKPRQGDETTDLHETLDEL